MKSSKLYHWFTNIDLLIVSVWSLFAMRYALLGFESIALIAIARIVLSFEMRRNSPWVLYSAVVFAIITIMSLGGYAFNQTFHRMMFNAVWLCLGTREVMSGFHPLDPDLQVWIYCLKGFWIVWFAVIPVFVGVLLNNYKTIDWKRKTIWVYTIVCVTVCGLITCAEIEAGVSIFLWLMTCLPIVYWVKYQRNGRSLIDILTSDKGISAYVNTWLIISFGYLSIGFALLPFCILPVWFYIVVCRAFNGVKIRFTPTLLVMMSGWLYWARLHFNSPQWWNITLLSLAVAIVLYVALDLARRYKKWFGALIMFVGVTIVIVPVTMGLNPYSVTEAYSTKSYCYRFSAPRGVFVISDKDGRIGLRDRYDVIVQPKYESFERVGNRGCYIMLTTKDVHGNTLYGFYDLGARKFIIDPDSNVKIDGVEKIGVNQFKLLDFKGRWFSTLKLPGFLHTGKEDVAYIRELSITPHFLDYELTVDDFLRIAEETKIENSFIEEETKTAMETANPTAYALLSRIWKMSAVECSPQNDRNLYLAFWQLVKDHTVYRGGFDRAVSEVQSIIDLMDDDSDWGMNESARLTLVMDNLKLMKNYVELMTLIPDCSSEYSAWHNLTEVMARYYYDYQYWHDSYNLLKHDVNHVYSNWLTNRTAEVKIENEIIGGCGDYVAHDSISGIPTIEKIFGYYSSDADAGRYDPMWHEIRPAYQAWIEARDSVASSLPKKQAIFYTEMTKSATHRIANDIKKLHLSPHDW